MAHSAAARYFSARVWLCLVIACVLSPFLFVLVQGIVAAQAVPLLQALGISSSAGFRVGFALFGVFGALVAAAILCLPLGWMESQRPVLVGGIVGLAGCAGVSWIWLSALPIYASWSHASELIALFAGCVVFAYVGAKGARRVGA
jgi:hypothetical protein